MTPTIRSRSDMNLLAPPSDRTSRQPSAQNLYNVQTVMKNEDSFEKMKYLPSPTPIKASNNHFNESFMGVAHDLSFDVRN